MMHCYCGFHMLRSGPDCKQFMNMMLNCNQPLFVLVLFGFIFFGTHAKSDCLWVSIIKQMIMLLHMMYDSRHWSTPKDINILPGSAFPCAQPLSSPMDYVLCNVEISKKFQIFPIVVVLFRWLFFKKSLKFLRWSGLECIVCAGAVLFFRTSFPIQLQAYRPLATPGVQALVVDYLVTVIFITSLKIGLHNLFRSFWLTCIAPEMIFCLLLSTCNPTLPLLLVVLDRFVDCMYYRKQGAKPTGDKPTDKENDNPSDLRKNQRPRRHPGLRELRALLT